MKRDIKYLPFILIWILSCTQPDYNNPFDPAGDKFQPTGEKRVIIINFEGDPSKSQWGWEQFLLETNNGKIDSAYIQDPLDEKRGQVLKINYDVSANDSSVAFWFQLLGSSDEGDDKGLFNVKTMGLRYLSFYARGEQGGERFQITFNDVDKNFTSPPYIIDRPLTVDWDKYRISLSGDLITKSVDPKSITHFDITFFNGIGPSKGIIFVDDFMFEWD